MINSQKIIIAVIGPDKTGKSSAIMQLFKRFPFSGGFYQIYPQKPEMPKYDIVGWGTFHSQRTGKQVKLGICSFGDDVATLKEHFKPLIDEQECNVIVVAAHTHRKHQGNTAYYISQLAKQYGYKLLTTAIIHDDTVHRMTAEEWENKGNGPISVNGVVLNDYFADCLTNLITSLL